MPSPKHKATQRMLIPVSTDHPYIVIGYGSSARLFCLKCAQPFPIPKELISHLAEHTTQEVETIRNQQREGAIRKKREDIQKEVRRQHREKKAAKEDS